MTTEGDSVADGHSPILYYCDHFSKKKNQSSVREDASVFFK